MASLPLLVRQRKKIDRATFSNLYASAFQTSSFNALEECYSASSENRTEPLNEPAVRTIRIFWTDAIMCEWNGNEEPYHAILTGSRWTWWVQSLNTGFSRPLSISALLLHLWRIGWETQLGFVNNGFSQVNRPYHPPRRRVRKHGLGVKTILRSVPLLNDVGSGMCDLRPRLYGTSTWHTKSTYSQNMNKCPQVLSMGWTCANEKTKTLAR